MMHGECTLLFNQHIFSAPYQSGRVGQLKVCYTKTLDIIGVGFLTKHASDSILLEFMRYTNVVIITTIIVVLYDISQQKIC